MTLDGIEGWGDAAPLSGYGTHTLESALRELRWFLGWEAGTRISRDALDDTFASPSVRFAIDTALHEIEAREHGFSSLCELSSGWRERVPVAALVETGTGVGDIESAAVAIKLKVGVASVEDDVARVRAIRARMGDAVKIRADANRAWDLETAQTFIEQCEELNLEYLEEPCRTLEAFAELALRSQTPLAVDETLHEVLETAAVGVDRRARLRQALGTMPDVSVWVVKPTYVGTWSSVCSIMKIAREEGKKVVLSSAYESGVGMRALLTLAAASPFDEPAGFDTYQRLATDVLLPRPEIRPPMVGVRAATSLEPRVDVSLLRTL